MCRIGPLRLVRSYDPQLKSRRLSGSAVSSLAIHSRSTQGHHRDGPQGRLDVPPANTPEPQLYVGMEISTAISMKKYAIV